MNNFVRMSKLSNIVGRSDYISNPNRQENILAKSTSIDWKPYQEYERTHKKSSKANNEGRELIIALPNNWSEFSEPELITKINELAQQLLPQQEYQWAVHWNKGHTNLHTHIIFSERNREYGNNNDVWDRDIYLTQDGKVARRKSDRAVDKNGNVKPPVHRKVEPKDEGKPKFSVKDTKFKSQKWLQQVKDSVIDFYQKYGITISEKEILHQYHEGKGSESLIIHTKNKRIKAINKWFKVYQSYGFEFPKPHTKDFYDMITTLQNPDTKLGIKTAFSLAVKKPKIMSFEPKTPDMEYKLQEKFKSEHIPNWKNSANGRIMFLSPDYHRICEIIKAVSEKQKPTIDLDHIIQLKNDYVRKCCVYSYLQSAYISTKAQEEYQKAKLLVKEFDATAKHFHSLNDEIKVTINPFKKIKLRSERDEVAEQLEIKANSLQYALGITLVYQGEEFNSLTATKDHTTAIYGYTQHPISQKRSNAESEIKRNQLIEKLKTENIDETSVKTALIAFKTACKEIPVKLYAEVYNALQNAKTPLFEFEVTGNISKGRITANYNIEKAIAIMKPHNKTEQEQEVKIENKRNDYGFCR